ncbi:MAG: DUF192 domain-containing protein [Chromatiales bacterium]|jgi:uncharacterized membrane protein (UPF0127 family)
MQHGYLQFHDELKRPVGLPFHVMKTENILERNRGLLKRPALQQQQGLWITPCNSIHTFGMQYAIDVIYLDRHMRIKKITESLPKYRLSGCLRAKSTLELPAGSARQQQLQPGLTASWSSHV